VEWGGKERGGLDWGEKESSGVGRERVGWGEKE